MTGVTLPPRKSRGPRAAVSKPTMRTLALAAAMAVAGIALALLDLRWARPTAPLTLYWWELVPAAVIADELGFHLEVREETHTFTLSELPLVLGCLFASPAAVISSRLIGSGLVHVLHRRQSGTKLAFNFANFLLETTLLLALVHYLVRGRPVTDWTTWLVIFAAVGATDLVSMAAVSQAIRWHGGRPRMASVLIATTATALVNVNLALLAAVVLWRAPYAIVLLAVVLGLTSLVYRGYADLSKRYASLKLLYDFTRTVGAQMSAQAVLQHMLARARELLSAEVAEVVLLDRVTGKPGFHQRCTGSAPQGTVVTLEGERQPTWPALVSNGGAVVVSRTDHSPAFAPVRAETGARDFVVAPLKAEDKVIGAIMVANRLGSVSSFDQEDRRLFATLANHASIAFENSQLVQRLRQEADERRWEALHDPLTGLPNRTLFAQQVEEALARGRVVLMLMDLDRFKEINDALGHDNGDDLLCKVASRILANLGSDGTACRFGGDEFGVLIPGLHESGAAEAFAARLLGSLSEPFIVDDLTLQVDASLGIALAPDHGADATTLFQKADVAMYQAKTSRSGSAVYSAEQDASSPRRLKLANEMRSALYRGDILVYFQPQASLRDGAVTSAEALLRWRHPELGFVGPDEFIPVAEANGMIGLLTNHVLHVALSQCAEWRRAGHHVGVAVNLAVRTLLDINFPCALAEMLHQYGVAAEHLALEITESGVMADTWRTIPVLEELALAGVRLSVDDFGKGNSSLAYLQRLPVHEVKVDKSFVFRMSSDVADAVIVQSIIELGHNLGLSVVAEGVEDQITWDRLRAMGCDTAQGYHLSKPVPAGVVTRWLQERANEHRKATLVPAGVAAASGSQA